MNTYRLMIIDFNKSDNKVVLNKYVEGLSTARSFCPPLHYSANGGYFTAWENNINYIVKKIGR